MEKVEGLHGDWQHITAAEAAKAEAAATDVPQVSIEGFEVTTVETVAPITEAERDTLRFNETPQVQVDITHLVAGPDGQMISGSAD
jgi:hypothetical protein